ncbi:hypothetical protein HYALB_00004610 [Hymenoscyphus albidus]|uniref:Uncharacterized protein n=1 Tax=Hymenoscyphus albidus TaxID=595503 RepID=A0A9N9M2R0_9HELO|nr:hypothetical protein HYALB_00004610 [Hymenoscyphus albidus]
MQPPIHPPRTQELLAPLLGALPSASISKDAPSALLPLLSPILRQRVQLLSSASTEPWLSLLCYDHAKTQKLEQAAKSESLEAHPVSGEVEVDWEYDVDVRYKRVDEETLQALVSLQPFGIEVKLIWCVNDEAGGGDGWRIGEVSVPDADGVWGEKSIRDAEDQFESHTARQEPRNGGTNGGSLLTPDEEEGDDDDYWAQYDNTPSQTPAAKHSPAPPALGNHLGSNANEEDYYAHYGNVQPAMDNHDPDEAQQNGDIESSLGRDEIARELQHQLSAHPELTSFPPPLPPFEQEKSDFIIHPRASSSTGSSGSDTVARLERRAAANSMSEQSETAIKQHISTTMKSLYRLAKVGGIDRGEFERLVRTELDCLGLMDEEEL